MSKYIDAEKLITEIERRIEEYNIQSLRGAELADVLSFITSLQQEQPGLPGIEDPGIPGKDYIPVEWVDACEKYGKWKIVKQEQPVVSVECYVRVYPTLDDKPRKWVSLCKHGICCDSIRDIPELESLGFKDDDTAIVTIARKEE